MTCARLAIGSLLIGMSIIFFLGCQENFIARSPSATTNTKTFGGAQEGPGGFTDHPSGDRYPYPEIIHRVYIPEYRPFAYTKCLAWRIEWPAYANTADTDRIPTVFTASSGALNSFYYLNAVSAQTSYNTNFSLYFNNKLEVSATLWEELDHVFVAPPGTMEEVRFAKEDQPLDNIMDWVTERPDLFELYYPEAGGVNEVEYEQGDFFIYYLVDQDLYGGVRIVSMSPRIIEVYLAVPNY
jgi:hypothetical protein